MAAGTDCPACDGAGKRQVFDIHFLYGDWTLRTCPDCDGAGVITDKAQREAVKRLVKGPQ